LELTSELLDLKRQELAAKQVQLWDRMLELAAEAEAPGKSDEEKLALNYQSISIWNQAFATAQDPKWGIKKFPNWPYIQQADYLWLKYRFTLWAKGRRLFFTWRFVGDYVWDTVTHGARYTFLQSRELADAGMDIDYALLWRARFIIDQLPKCVRPKYKQKKKHQTLEVYPPNGMAKATIRAVSADFDAFRSFPMSGALLDEVAMQQHPELAFLAARPAAEQFGRITGVSTPNGENYFHRAVESIG